jgi:GT2 family glycosyltransferase
MDRRPPAPTPAASVVICTHSAERWDGLVAAVESVRAQVLPVGCRHEVLVVVDHNAALLRHATTRFPDVRVVANANGPGLSGARNTGVEDARGAIVAFLDDDAVAEPGWLAAHVVAFDDPVVVGTGGAIAPAWEDTPPDWWPPEFDWVVGCTYEGWAGARACTATAGRPVVIRNPIGANMAFLRALVLEVGGFSGALGRTGAGAAGCEETELAIRIGQLLPGSEIVAVPAARVQHRVPPGRATFGYFARRCLAEGRSKATVARSVGAGAATTAERSYVLRTLPTAVARSLRRGQPARAAAVLVGLACTTAGFATSCVSR